MTIKKQLTLLCLLAAVLAGCAGNADSGNNSSPALTEQTTTPPSASASTAPSPEPSATPSPEPLAEAKTLYRMNDVYRFVPIDETAPKKAVLLTFDDGPKDETLINSIFDTLDKHGAKAIFFVNGYRVKANPELLKLIHERGGSIGNHSYDHINLKNEETAVVEEQLSSVQNMVKELTGETPKFFRPPFGSGGDSVKEIAKNHDMLYMTWSNGSLDWDSSARDKPEVVIRNVMDQLHPGANILMHELPWTAEALDELLGKIEAEGYTFIDPATIELTN
ncbi:polysaccharide deacetylase family protein [Paenibacillus sp. 1011MAR3C5]|uniref:polysaccharide deacetylase family protein n=1 Tax=Paenibacillus sp. 1011MAR3C5 TaxID=1675787 RepID=UPI000E6D15A7|nr:polysaccharide deacetylase family protein [Paenibacillus sp. 1011MAR3C5]RJE90011.1 polysaccharide deacetylase family protein [Paenibacillus sp. 1011MAR3C5]